MQPFIIVYNIKIQAEHRELMIKSLKRLLIETSEDSSNVEYKLYEVAKKETLLIIYAVWKSRRDWELHLNSGKVENIMNEVGALIEELSIQEIIEITI